MLTNLFQSFFSWQPALWTLNSWLSSLDMKTKVVQHVQRIKFSGFQFFKLFKFLITFLVPWLSDIFMYLFSPLRISRRIFPFQRITLGSFAYSELRWKVAWRYHLVSTIFTFTVHTLLENKNNGGKGFRVWRPLLNPKWFRCQSKIFCFACYKGHLYIFMLELD